MNRSTDFTIFNITGVLEGFPAVERRLSSLAGVFADSEAYTAVLEQGDPIVYSVASVEPAQGAGDLHYGVGIVQPGRIGDEYYQTKGHLHTWREAAEVYLGVSGEGMMLLEDERTGETKMLPLVPQGVVYVPGYVAHRTINTGSVPLVYLGIYPAQAGHDYGAFADRNFQDVVLEQNGRPERMARQSYLAARRQTGWRASS